MSLNPIIGRRVRLDREGRTVAWGTAIDSFYADNFYRIVVEIDKSITHLEEIDGVHHIAVLPIGNERTAFAAFVMPDKVPPAISREERELIERVLDCVDPASDCSIGNDEIARVREIVARLGVDLEAFEARIERNVPIYNTTYSSRIPKK